MIRNSEYEPYDEDTTANEETIILPNPTAVPYPLDPDEKYQKNFVFLPIISNQSDSVPAIPEHKTPLHYVDTLEAKDINSPAVFLAAAKNVLWYNYHAIPQNCLDPNFLAMVRGVFDINRPIPEECLDSPVLAGNEIFSAQQDNITTEQFADNLYVLEQLGVKQTIIFNEIAFLQSRKDKFREGLRIYREKYGNKNPSNVLSIGLHFYREPHNDDKLEELENWIVSEIQSWQTISAEEFGQNEDGSLKVGFVVTEFGVITQTDADPRIVPTVNAMLKGFDRAGIKDAFLFSRNYPYGDFTNLVDENGELTDLGHYFLREVGLRNNNVSTTTLQPERGDYHAHLPIIQSNLMPIVLMLFLMNKFKQLRKRKK